MGGWVVMVADTPSSAKPKVSGRRRRRIPFWLMLTAAAVFANVSVIFRPSFGPPYYQSSITMENGIQPGGVTVDVTGPGIRRGDVVILSLPQSGAGAIRIARRVIGLPGDRVDCCDATGRVTVNNKPLSESYVYPGDPPSSVPFSVTLGKGQIWVLGDHRSIAVDSRIWGPVPESDVIGRVVVIVRGMSLHFLSTPQTFITAGLAPPDGRTMSFIWRVALNFLAALTFVIVMVLGLIRTVMRITRMVIRRRQRRRGTPPQPGLWVSVDGPQK